MLRVAPLSPYTAAGDFSPENARILEGLSRKKIGKRVTKSIRLSFVDADLELIADPRRVHETNFSEAFHVNADRRLRERKRRRNILDRHRTSFKRFKNRQT